MFFYKVKATEGGITGVAKAVSKLGWGDPNQVASTLVSRHKLNTPVELWFTEKGFKEVMPHMPDSGIKWYRIKSVAASLVLDSNEHCLYVKPLLVGKNFEFKPE